MAATFRRTSSVRVATPTPSVLEAYDAIGHAMQTGAPFMSRLDPPPGEGLRHERHRWLPFRHVRSGWDAVVGE